MISRYGIFCRVVEQGSFTHAAEDLGYSQSAVSQNVRALEQETGVTLLSRRKDGVQLTQDGQEFYPYIQSIFQAEQALERKRQETMGLQNSLIRIGTFTSVSRNLLPTMMKRFKETYPDVRFVLRQGEYTSIPQWIRQGEIDFGFVNEDAVEGMETHLLYEDHMLAALPQGVGKIHAVSGGYQPGTVDSAGRGRTQRVAGGIPSCKAQSKSRLQGL